MLLATAPGALAQPTPTPERPPDAEPPESSNDVLAKKLYRDGDRRYSEGRYTEAIRNFERAYELSKRPLILFAMANTFERMGEYAKAREKLQKFVQASPSGDVDAVRQRIRELEKRVAAKKVAAAELASLRARPIECKEKVCPVHTSPPKDSKLPIVLWGASGVALVSGIIFGGVARGAHNDAAKSCDSSGGPSLCTAEARSELDRERRFTLLTDVSFAAAVVTAGLGTYLWWRERRRKRAREAAFAIRPNVSPSAAGVVLVGGF